MSSIIVIIVFYIIVFGVAHASSSMFLSTLDFYGFDKVSILLLSRALNVIKFLLVSLGADRCFSFPLCAHSSLTCFISECGDMRESQNTPCARTFQCQMFLLVELCTAHDCLFCCVSFVVRSWCLCRCWYELRMF